MLYNEFEAAARFGMQLDEYFDLPRAQRAHLTAFVTVENAIAGMRSYDIAQAAKEKGKKGKST